jgi:hypothetical protein
MLDTDLRFLLRQSAKIALRQRPAPVTTIVSSGQIDPNLSDFKASRRAFQDADNGAILALAWRLWGKRELFERARDILLAWANVNQPTGHPIDETRLQGLLVAYDLLQCDLTSEGKEPVIRWLRDMKGKKMRWRFGPKTAHNNHKTHHHLMLLMLDKVLGDKGDFVEELGKVGNHLIINIDSKTGETVDFKERHALYYHVYNLEAWLEIALLTGHFNEPISMAFDFMKRRIEAGDIHSEFEGSKALIDELRGKAGFGYGVGHKTFDVSRAGRVIVSYYTLSSESPSSFLWSIATGNTSRRIVFLLSRRALWKKH